MQNTLIVFVAFSSILDSIKPYVISHIRQYFQNEIIPIILAYPNRHIKDLLPCDPEKPTTMFQHPRFNSKPMNIDEFAKLYVGNASRGNNFSLSTSSDIRVFLIILSRAGCFPMETSDIAQRLKDIRDSLAHGNDFDHEKTKEVLKEMEDLLCCIPENEHCRRMLKQLQKYGMRYIQSLTSTQLSELKSSLDEKDLADSTRASLKSFMASTINTDNGIENHPLAERKKNNWTKVRILYELLPVEWMHCVTSSGGTLNLSTIINSKKLKFVEHKGLFGFGFKMAKLPFAKGSSRLAYRGHFDELEEYSQFDSTEVVVKKSTSIPAKEFLKIQAVAEVFEQKWNELYKVKGSEEIRFLALYLADIEGSQMTIEDYINKGKYTKWSDNNGYVNTSSYEPVLDAFSHWTYEITRGQMMVVDLQGEKRGNRFLLTDPAIHSATGEFGSNNRRAKGMYKFFKTHICNAICSSMGLTVQS